MTIEYIWNNGTVEQRTNLLKSIYGESWIMFHRDVNKDFKDIPYGVQRRLGRLEDVYKARNNK